MQGVVEKKGLIGKHFHGHRRRLYDRFLKAKQGSMLDYELLEILLFNTHPRKDMKPLAKELLKVFGSLSSVLHAEEASLKKITGLNERAMIQFKLARELCVRMLQEAAREETIIQNWRSLLDYCRTSMGFGKTEQFRVLYLNKKLAIISDELQETGTVDQTPIYPREIIKRALELGATSLILVHNHPSGSVAPSQLDVQVTKQVVNAGRLFGISIHDHIIVTATEYYSFKSNDLL